MVALAAGCYKKPSAEIARRPNGMFGENGAETLLYVKGLAFTGAGGLKAPYNCAACPGGKIQLLMIPATTAQNWNWQADLGPGAPGDVVAQVINIDTVKFDELNLAPGEVAYAWVGQIAANGAPKNRGFGVYKLDNNGNRAGEWSVVPKDSIEFCPHDTPYDAPSIKTHHEGGGPCAVITSAAGTGKNRLAGLGISAAYAATARSASTALVGLGQLWITCSGGCCQVNAN
jgi:hypothetical protein